MASNKGKQMVKNWLRNVFTRNHNSRSDGGKRIDKDKEKAMTGYGYKTDVNASDFGDNQGGTKKTVMWCLIAVAIGIGILVYCCYSSKKTDTIAETETEVLNLNASESGVEPV